MSKRERDQLETQIRQGMARAFFVDAWANEQEEKGRSFSGQDLMHVAPPTGTDAKSAAIDFADRLRKANGNDYLSNLYISAVRAGGKEDPRLFGHYMAMQAMGHGVSWFDDNPEFSIHIPRYEYHRGMGRYARSQRGVRK